MMRSPACLPFAAAAVLALAMSACSPAPQPSMADRGAVQACRARAEAIYSQQNRTSLYRTDTMDAPFASTGMRTDSTAGLSERYGYDTIVQGCLRGSEANTEIGTGAAAAAAPRPNTARPPGAEPLAGPAAGAPLSAPP